MQELKPCPFCGDEVLIYYSSATRGFYFNHRHKQGAANDCILLTPAIILGDFKCLQDAYDAWNRRADNGGADT